MIEKSKGGYTVYSEHKKKGKRKKLSRKYKSRKEAVKRLREIEYFKHRKMAALG